MTAFICILMLLVHACITLACIVMAVHTFKQMPKFISVCWVLAASLNSVPFAIFISALVKSL